MKNTEFDKNIILYGPPGTGKTYHSAIYAVAICDGKSLEELTDYDEVMKRYKELKEEAEFKEEAANTGMLDQSMIDALLGNLQADKPAEDVKNADVIPFPQQGQTDLSTEEAHAEEVAEAVHEVEQDITDTTMNMDAEPAPTMPVDDNPNRTLSPEEIAALFASMQ
mgnify:CR=1 FL=1